MKRRDVLAGTGLVLGAAVAGCLSQDSEADNAGADSGDNDGTETDEPDDGTGPGNNTPNGRTTPFERYVQLQAVDDVPGSVPVDFDVGIERGKITSQGRARLEVTATNTGETAREVPTPFYKGASEGEPRVVLHSQDAPDGPNPDTAPDCIGDPAATQAVLEWTSESPLTHRLDAGATGSDGLLLTDDPTAEGCFPTGEYRFEETHTIDGTTFSWGFTLVITDDPGPDESRTYEECSREVIPSDQFPADIQAEIDAALDGVYEADRVFLREAMDTDRSFVSVNDTYYEARVTVDDGTERLELDVVDPKVLPRARPVDVALEYGTERTIAIELVADDGTVLVEESRQIYESAEVEFGQTNRVGTHNLHVTVTDGATVDTETTEQVTINESRFSIIVVVEEDGLTVSGAVADLGICQFDGREDGEGVLSENSVIG